MNSNSISIACDLASRYGGEILDDAVLENLGEPDEEQAYEDVVGIAEEDCR